LRKKLAFILHDDCPPTDDLMHEFKKKEIRLVEVWIAEKYLLSNDFLDFIKGLLMG
jgi:hypothetical protein